MLDLNKLAKECKLIAYERYANNANVANPDDCLKQCASEVVEAEEAKIKAYNCYKYLDYPTSELDNLVKSYGEELADIIICVLITASVDGIDIEKAVLNKIEKNKLRAEGRGDKL